MQNGGFMDQNKVERAVKDLQEKMSEQDKVNAITADIQEAQSEVLEEHDKTLRNLCIFAILQCVVIAALIFKLYTGGLI